MIGFGWQTNEARLFSDAPAADFQWHTKAITSIEWNPMDDSELAVSGSDNQVSIWDLSLELDGEQPGTVDSNEPAVPPQLLFIHQVRHCTLHLTIYPPGSARHQGAPLAPETLWCSHDQRVNWLQHFQAGLF